MRNIAVSTVSICCVRTVREKEFSELLNTRSVEEIRNIFHFVRKIMKIRKLMLVES